MHNVVKCIKPVFNKNHNSITTKHFYKNICINYLKNNDNFFFDSILIMRLDKTKVAKAKSNKNWGC